MQQFAADEDRYLRFLITGDQTAKGNAVGSYNGGLNGIILGLPGQQRSKPVVGLKKRLEDTNATKDGPKL